MSESLMPTYAPLPLAFEHGAGAWLWDTHGNKYFDAVSGIAVCGLGHAHDAVAQALCDQARRLVHTSNLYHIPQQQALAQQLCNLAGMDKAFFCNSGAEANEAALKIARLYGHTKDIESPTVVVMENSFHGRTLATLTASGSRKVQAGFEPLVQGFLRVPFNDLEALNIVAQNSPHAVAVLLEPIQGEGGIRIPDAGYLEGVRAICNDYGWLMMLDEVQTGMGRTGQLFAFQHHHVVPDVVTLAKALGNGIPIGACLARGVAATSFQPGNHASTFGGNPLACAGALAVLQTLEQEQLVPRATALGKQLLNGLQSRLGHCDIVKDIRGQGLMIGIELDRNCTELPQHALKQGLLINVTAERVVRLLPPLILSDEEAELLVEQLSQLILNFAQRL